MKLKCQVCYSVLRQHVVFFQVHQDAMTVMKAVQDQNTRVSVWLVVECQPQGKSV